MERGNSLTISAPGGPERGFGAGARRFLSGVAGVGFLLLSACTTIEIGPPPESDPPLVPQSQKPPPPPPQPTEPQPWSRDLNFDNAPAASDRDQMAEGLVASDAPATYSDQRLTFESALDEEKPPSEAEQTLKRAQDRAAAAGKPLPPQVAAAPVTEVDAAALPAGDGEAPAPHRESRLPPPPKFPPLGATPPTPPAPPAATQAGEATPAAPPAEEVDAQWAQRGSRLPAPPKFPQLQPAAEGSEPAEVAAAEDPEAAGAEPAAQAGEAPPAPPPAEEVDPQWAQRGSRLPAPPKFPPLQPAAGTAAAATPSAAAESPMPAEPTPAAPAVEVAEAAPAPTPSDVAIPPAETASGVTEVAAAGLLADDPEKAAAFAVQAWDAPVGTILVQVSAVPDGSKVMQEWERLQARYPQVLKPLRLVVDEAKVGNKGVFYRVQAGAFDSQAGAAGACDMLISQGQACFVVVR